MQRALTPLLRRRQVPLRREKAAVPVVQRDALEATGPRIRLPTLRAGQLGKSSKSANLPRVS